MTRRTGVYRKATASSGQACVMLATYPSAVVGVADSKSPDGLGVTELRLPDVARLALLSFARVRG